MLFDVELHCDKWKNCKTNLFGGTCACDYSGNDEWLPYYCEFAETVCPHPSGVACWEQYLTHKDKREERDD